MREARRRLKIVDWYRLESRKFSADRRPDAALTCRHFGIHRSYLSRWRARYSKGGVRALEDRSRSPKRRRQPVYGMYYRADIKAHRRRSRTVAKSGMGRRKPHGLRHGLRMRKHNF